MNEYIGAKKRKRPKAFPAQEKNEERKWETEKTEFQKTKNSKQEDHEHTK
jgi:hypothetical protein